MKGKIKLAIVGSRTITDPKVLDRYGIEMLKIQGFYVEDIERIISGGAKGVDTLASEFAYYAAIPFKAYNAKWLVGGDYNPRAGFERNTAIVEKCDAALVIWDGTSNGTQDSLTKLIDYNKPYILIKTRDIAIRSKDKKKKDRPDLWSGAIHTVVDEIFIGNPLGWEKLYEKRNKVLNKEDEDYVNSKRKRFVSTGRKQRKVTKRSPKRCPLARIS